MWSHMLSISALILIALAVIGCGTNTSPTPVAVDQSQLNEIIDGIPAVQCKGYEYLLMHAARVNETALERAGVVIPYAKLTRSPKDYRGQPITIQGLLWRLYELPTNGTVDFKHLYEAWIVSDEEQFYRVVCSQLPANLQLGDKLRNVHVTGYFLGIEGHESCYDIGIDSYRIETCSIFAPTLLSRRIVVTGEATLPPNIRVNLTLPLPKKEVDVVLPDIKVGLQSDKSGKLIQLTLGGNNLGNDDAAFARLNAEILKIIGRPGNPLTKDIGVAIDVDFECDYKFVAKAVASCAGREHPETKQQIPYIKNIKFWVPRDPKE
ncbi:MAG: hypothetical protein WCJ09_17860 [Planctomycetota bacterium]